jgi:hypothetical protein
MEFFRLVGVIRWYGTPTLYKMGFQEKMKTLFFYLDFKYLNKVYFKFSNQRKKTPYTVDFI